MTCLLVLPPLSPAFYTFVESRHGFISTPNLHLSIISFRRWTLFVRTHGHYYSALEKENERLTGSLINVLPCRSTTHDVVYLFQLVHSSVVVYFVDDKFIRTGSAAEAMHKFVFFRKLRVCNLSSLDGKIIPTRLSVTGCASEVPIRTPVDHVYR